jgi:hypothetical protein
MLGLLVAGLSMHRSLTRASSEDASAYHATGIVIENAQSGPKLAAGGMFLTFPPSGGDIPLVGWSWDAIADEQTAQGVSWSGTPVEVTGSWDGQSLHVTSAQPYTPGLTSAPFSAGVDDECAGSPEVDALSRLQAASIGVRAWSIRQNGSDCKVVIQAIGPNEDLDDALTAFRVPPDLSFLVTPTS